MPLPRGLGLSVACGLGAPLPRGLGLSVACGLGVPLMLGLCSPSPPMALSLALGESTRRRLSIRRVRRLCSAWVRMRSRARVRARLSLCWCALGARARVRQAGRARSPRASTKPMRSGCFVFMRLYNTINIHRAQGGGGGGLGLSLGGLSLCGLQLCQATALPSHRPLPCYGAKVLGTSQPTDH